MERHRGDAGTKHEYSMSAIIRGKGNSHECGKNITTISLSQKTKGSLLAFGLARNRTFKNDFVKPEDQRGLARFGLARTDDKPRGEAEFTQAIPRREGRRRKSNRTFKNDFVKPEDQRELARFGLARNRTFKNAKVIHYFQSAKH